MLRRVGDGGACQAWRVHLLAGGDTFFVNLYIPAEARWAKRGAVVTLDTAYPMDGQATLSFSRLDRAGRFPLALRVPGWANGQAQVEVNGQAVTPRFERGYAVVDRRWKAGDTVSIRLPLDLRVETTPGDESVVAVLRGPMVMAADLGGREDNGTRPTRCWSAPIRWRASPRRSGERAI